MNLKKKNVYSLSVGNVHQLQWQLTVQCHKVCHTYMGKDYGNEARYTCSIDKYLFCLLAQQRPCYKGLPIKQHIWKTTAQ